MDLNKISLKSLPISFDFLDNDSNILTISEDNFLY